jgi:hypothetical protein
MTTPADVAFKPHGLIFNDRAHKYTLDGKPIPGVTSLIGDGLPKKALTYWAARSVAEYVVRNLPLVAENLASAGEGPTIQMLKDVPWQSARDKAARGTAVHAVAEKLAHGEPVDVPAAIAAHANGYARWLDANPVEVILTERPLANRAVWYAGTPDLVATLAGQTWLLDVKTSVKGPYGSDSLQLAAYANAEFYLPLGGYDETPMPHIERAGVLHVTEHGTELHEVRWLDAAWKDFRHVAYVARAKDRIESQLAPWSADA